MSLPDSYVLKQDSIPAYFDSILKAQAPERFSQKFLENLGHSSQNDRLLIGLLKDLSFLNTDGTPLPRYYDFLDRTRSKQILAQAITEAFSDLFAVNKCAYELSKDDVKNKLRTLYAGKKSDGIIDRIARTFTALVEYADFSAIVPQPQLIDDQDTSATKSPEAQRPNTLPSLEEHKRPLEFGALQYQINIVLPDSRDQAVYDAIFRSLREHLS